MTPPSPLAALRALVEAGDGLHGLVVAAGGCPAGQDMCGCEFVADCKIGPVLAALPAARAALEAVEHAAVDTEEGLARLWLEYPAKPTPHVYRKAPMSYEHERKPTDPNKTYCHVLPRLWAQGWAVQEAYLADRGLSRGTAARNGWYPSLEAGDTTPRMVIPAASRIHGNLYWQARCFNAARTPRYQSPPNARGDALAVVWPDASTQLAVVVEGPLDALKAAEARILGIGLMGARPPGIALDHVAELCRDKVVFAVADRDAVAEMAGVVLGLTERGIGCILLTLDPEYKDLAEVPTNQVLPVLRKASSAVMIPAPISGAL